MAGQISPLLTNQHIYIDQYLFLSILRSKSELPSPETPDLLGLISSHCTLTEGGGMVPDKYLTSQEVGVVEDQDQVTLGTCQLVVGDVYYHVGVFSSSTPVFLVSINI